MTNGNDMIIFEEQNKERLETEFLEIHKEEYDKFVFEQFNGGE